MAKGRPEKNTVDYFPFLCKEGKAMYYIDSKYGNDGYATWVRILRQLAVTNNHWLNLSDKVEIMFLASKCKVSEERLIDIITDLSNMGEFNNILWAENRIIWCQKFIDYIQEAYKMRKNKCISLSDLLTHLFNLGVRKSNKLTISLPDNTQIKEKKRKEKKKRENKIIFIPPTLEEFKNYFKENGFIESAAIRAWNGYANANPPWTDTTGKPIRSWPQKCQNVWFTDENKIKAAGRPAITY